MERDKKKELLAALVGLVDPWLREKAQKTASKVPEDSPLRNKLVEAALGSLKGLIEAWAEKLPPVAATAVEKATDFSDFLAGALGSNAPAVENHLQEFITDAFRRLREAENPTVEFEKIKLEFGMRQQLLELVQQSQKKESEPKDKPTTWAAERLSGFNQRLEEHIKAMKTHRAEKGGKP